MIKIKDKRGNFMKMFNSMDYLASLKGAKFAFTISKNRKLLKPIVKKLQEIGKVSEGFVKFQEEINKINLKYCEKDNDNKPIVVENRYNIPEKALKEYNKATETVKERYKTVVEEREKQIELFNKTIEEEIEVELHCIDVNSVPSDISVSEMEIISMVIKE